jgi:hypothetical protein
VGEWVQEYKSVSLQNNSLERIAKKRFFRMPIEMKKPEHHGPHPDPFPGGSRV